MQTKKGQKSSNGNSQVPESERYRKISEPTISQQKLKWQKNYLCFTVVSLSLILQKLEYLLQIQSMISLKSFLKFSQGIVQSLKSQTNYKKLKQKKLMKNCHSYVSWKVKTKTLTQNMKHWRLVEEDRSSSQTVMNSVQIH